MEKSDSKERVPMIEIAICEDEESERLDLEKKLKELKWFVKAQIDLFADGQALAERYQNGKRYDFVFLDVDMPALNGIETGKIIHSLDSKAIILFVTAYPQYAIDAFDCGAFHYLLKNNDETKFYSVLLKAIRMYQTNHQTFSIATKEGLLRLPVSDIYYVECCQKHLKFFPVTEKPYVTKLRLGDAYKLLAPYGFYQVHQGFLVNFEKVIAIRGYDVVLDNQKRVMISVRKHTEVVKAYAEYLKRCM